MHWVHPVVLPSFVPASECANPWDNDTGSCRRCPSTSGLGSEIRGGINARLPQRVARLLAGALGQPFGMVLVVPGEPVMHRPPQAAEQEPGPDPKLRNDDEHLPGHAGILARDAEGEAALSPPLRG